MNKKKQNLTKRKILQNFLHIQIWHRLIKCLFGFFGGDFGNSKGNQPYQQQAAKFNFKK